MACSLLPACPPACLPAYLFVVLKQHRVASDSATRPPVRVTINRAYLLWAPLLIEDATNDYRWYSEDNQPLCPLNPPSALTNQQTPLHSSTCTVHCTKCTVQCVLCSMGRRAGGSKGVASFIRPRTGFSSHVSVRRYVGRNRHTREPGRSPETRTRSRSRAIRKTRVLSASQTRHSRDTR